MKKGLVRIGLSFIADVLKFPPDWEIENITMKKGDSYITAIIAGNDFPEFTEIKECELIVHTERLTYEVKER